MKKTVILLGLLILLSNCNHNNISNCTLTGIIENIKDGTVLNLVDIDSGKVCQKINVQGGKFKTNLKLITPRFFGIWQENPKHDSDRLYLWLENSKININANFKYLAGAEVKGSLSNEIYNKYLAIEKDYLKIKTASVRLLNISTNQLTIDSIQKQNEEILVHYRPALLKYYSDNINSEVAFHFLYTEPIKYKSALLKSDIKNLYNNLPEEKKNSKEGKLLKEFYSFPNVPKIGDKYIDISLDTPEGKAESISKNLGKYTILEFWSSGCPASLWMRPRLKDMYNLYHKKGLNIIGISGDNDYDSWRQAIQNDTIPWINISDLKSWYNKAFLIYGIYITPSMILLDDKGVIIDNQLSQKWIELELENRFK